MFKTSDSYTRCLLSARSASSMFGVELWPGLHLALAYEGNKAWIRVMRSLAVSFFKCSNISNRPELIRKPIDITDALRSGNFNRRFGCALLPQPCVK